MIIEMPYSLECADHDCLRRFTVEWERWVWRLNAQLEKYGMQPTAVAVIHWELWTDTNPHITLDCELVPLVHCTQGGGDRVPLNVAGFSWTVPQRYETPQSLDLLFVGQLNGRLHCVSLQPIAPIRARTRTPVPQRLRQRTDPPQHPVQRVVPDTWALQNPTIQCGHHATWWGELLQTIVNQAPGFCGVALNMFDQSTISPALNHPPSWEALADKLDVLADEYILHASVELRSLQTGK